MSIGIIDYLVSGNDLHFCYVYTDEIRFFFTVCFNDVIHLIPL